MTGACELHIKEMLRAYRALVGNVTRALVGNVMCIQSFGRKYYVHTQLW